MPEELNIESWLKEFIKEIKENKIFVYNEFSLQHELGIFLRAKCSVLQNGTSYKIEFERNICHFKKFFAEKDNLEFVKQFVKHEIDIVIYNDNERYAIELKFPRNGQYPEQMYAFVKDIRFMEQLYEKVSFNNTYCLTLVEQKPFYHDYKKESKTKIYGYFRKNVAIHGKIEKSTGKSSEFLIIGGNHTINWEDCGSEMKYYIVNTKEDYK